MNIKSTYHRSISTLLTLLMFFSIVGFCITTDVALGALPGERSVKKGDDVFLGGNYIEVGVSKSGSFGTESSAPAGFHPYNGGIGLSVDGDGFDTGNNPTTGDFFLPGSPEEGFTIGYKIGETVYNFTNAERRGVIGITTTTENQSAGDMLKAVTTGSASSFQYTQVVQFDKNDKFFKTTVTIKNISGSTLTDVRYLRSFDPDQDVQLHGNYTTYNYVLENPTVSPRAIVQAKGASSGDSFFFVAYDSRARAAANVDFAPRDVYQDGLYAVDGSRLLKLNPTSPVDSAIHLTFALGDLAPGNEATLEYYSSLNPDFETGMQEIVQEVAQEAGITVPSVPLNVSATAGDGQATINFDPPTSSGGAINGYTVTASPGGLTASGSSSSIVLSGLTNGTNYTFTVTAFNDAGDSDASSESNVVMPIGAPYAPTNVQALAGNGQAEISFTAPGSGGSDIIDYTVTASPSGLTASGISSPITMSGLTNGTSYTFKVTARNGIGTGTASTPSSAVTPATVPLAPSIVSAVAGDGQAVISFDPPANNGGASIHTYTVTASPGGLTTSGITSPITVAGLTNGTGYTFTVTATNSIGESSSSSSSALVIPATVPSVPTSISAIAGNGQATISFDPPASSGGAVISNYIVTASPGGITASGIGSPITLTGLTNGTGYTFTVTATNSAGESMASSESALVIPAVPPVRSRSSAPNTVTTTVNGQNINIGTKTNETNKDGQSQTVIQVNPSTVSNLINTMEPGSTLTIPVTNGTNSNSATNTEASQLRMTVGQVDQLFHQNITLTVDTGQIQYSLPPQSIDVDNLVAKFGTGVDQSSIEFDITISDVPTKMLEVVENTAAKDEFAIVIPPVEFNVTATYNGQTVLVNQFSQHVSREIALPAGIDPKKITTAIVVKEDGTTYHVPTDVYQKNGQWYARINSLTNSVYIPIYNEATFADTKGRWFEAPVAEAASRTILNGYADGTFRGTNPITRAEFAAMIVNTLGMDRLGTSKYSDVTAERWFYGAVSRASEYKVVSGRLDGSFDPNAYITRQEAMIMMQRAGEICGLVPGEGNAAAAAATAASSAAATLSNDYADQAAISTWAREAVEYNLNVGLMKGSNGQLKPRDNITRAEAAVTILRLLQKSHLIDPRSAI